MSADVWLCTAYSDEPGGRGGISKCSATFRETDRGWQKHDPFRGFIPVSDDERERHRLVRVEDLPRHP